MCFACATAYAPGSAFGCLALPLCRLTVQSQLQGLTEAEKARHALHLAEAVEKMRRRGSKSGTSQVQAQAAAVQPRNRVLDADSPATDLPKHLLWSRKYQPSDVSEVTSQHAWKNSVAAV